MSSDTSEHGLPIFELRWRVTYIVRTVLCTQLSSIRLPRDQSASVYLGKIWFIGICLQSQVTSARVMAVVWHGQVPQGELLPPVQSWSALGICKGGEDSNCKRPQLNVSDNGLLHDLKGGSMKWDLYNENIVEDFIRCVTFYIYCKPIVFRKWLIFVNREKEHFVVI